MKIPVEIYKTIRFSLINLKYETELQFPEDKENNKKWTRELDKQLKDIENAFKWLGKHKRKKKPPCKKGGASFKEENIKE